MDDPIVMAFRRNAAMGLSDHTDLPVRPNTQIGTRLPYFPIDHTKFHGRPSLVMALYKLGNADKSNRYGNDIVALELAESTTRIDSQGVYYSDKVIYRSPGEIAHARANNQGAYKMDVMTRAGNHRKHFAHNNQGFGVIDPVLWPEIIAARVDALFHNKSRQEVSGRQEVPDCWIRHGLVLDISKDKIADAKTFAADVPDFYEPAQRKNLARWYPAGLTRKDINTIIGIVDELGPSGRMNADGYERFTHERRAFLGAELGHYYLGLKNNAAHPGATNE